MVREVKPGDRFGMAVIIELAPRFLWPASGARCFYAQCDCGKRYTLRADTLERPGVRSCGCYRDARIAEVGRKHGAHGSATWKTWSGMLARCADVNDSRYGGRGIAVCERWAAFENFLADMGERPDGMTIERRDNSKGYEPGNCVWATATQQARNKRNTVRLTAFGETKPLAEWAAERGIKYATLWARIKAGASPEAALGGNV